MDLTGKNILLISPEPWNHLFVSKHHYAIHLAQKGNNVFFLNPPASINKIEKTDYQNLWSVDYIGFPKGLRFYPSILKRYFIKKKFCAIEKLCNTNFEVIWSFDNSVFYDFSALPTNLYSISHIVDWNQDFEFESACRTASLCLASSTFILNKQKRFNANAHFIQHGVAKVPIPIFETTLPGKNKVKAVYAGNLSIPYIDWELIKNLVVRHKEVDFCFAGTGEKDKSFRELQGFPNVYYLGVLDFSRLKAVLFQADLLLLAYLYDQYPEQLANPHKLMQYFGVGKCIVSTWTEEYITQSNNDMIMMAKNGDDYLVKFGEALSCLDVLNSEERQLLRRRFALDNTYEIQIKRIQALIN